MFGDRLAYLRKQKKLSQYELAERLGFSRGQLANYEQGKRQPDYETLQKIADYFDVSTDYLLGRIDNPNLIAPGSSSSVTDLKRHLKHISEKGLSVLSKPTIEKEHPDENLFFLDEKNLTEEEIEALKEHLKFLRWKAKQENEK